MKTPSFPISVLVTLLWWTLGTGAKAQPESKPVSTAKTAPAQPAGTPSPARTAAQDNAPPADGDLKFVVALFRHGVRAPLKEFADNANKYSGGPWPSATPWGVANWGDLTPRGGQAVLALGEWYGSYYSKILGDGFKAYLSADVDERTQKTADALMAGLKKSRVKVTLAPPDSGPDPLFHPFQANCGTPNKADLDRIANQIKAECREWLCAHKDQLTMLDEVLDCPNELGNPTCEPLGCVGETVSAWASPTPRASASPTPRPSSPIKWDGQFSYASSATEAFLLEYANKMPSGWGRVEVGQSPARPRLLDLLQLHEFYFEKTERDEYLAGLQGANLVREIHDQLSRKAGLPLDGKCPRGQAVDQFVGLVGHDTNLAHLNTLLNVSWKFNNPNLPDDTRNLPDNDALPAGALVFELRGDKPNHRVRIHYVTQSLGQIRDALQPDDSSRVFTTCGDESRPCEMSLEQFNKVAGDAIKKYGPFLSNCKDGQQTCP
jgi:4-phytase/acid phosphatase